jgi:trehalose 6-phosphate synthase/phosphatase
MLGANLVCFQVILPFPIPSDATLTPLLQTYSYSRHFISTCVRVCGYESTSAVPPRGGTARVMGIDVEGHVATVMHCPVGVDAERVGRDV